MQQADLIKRKRASAFVSLDTDHAHASQSRTTSRLNLTLDIKNILVRQFCWQVATCSHASTSTVAVAGMG